MKHSWLIIIAGQIVGGVYTEGMSWFEALTRAVWSGMIPQPMMAKADARHVRTFVGKHTGWLTRVYN